MGPKIPTEIWVLVSAAFLIALGYGLIAPIIPQFARSFDVSMAAAGAVISIFACTRLIFAPSAGKLSDKLGSRGIYLTGLTTVAVTTGLIALAQSYWQILLLRGLAGIGSTMFTVSAMGIIVRFAPPTIRGKCSSAYSSAFLIGNIVGPVAGAGLAWLGMRPPFVIYGIGLLIAVGVVAWKMPAAGGGRTGRHDAQAPMRFAEAIKDKAYRCLLISAFAHGWSNFGVRVATLPLFAAAVFTHGGQIAGLAMAAFAGGNAICLQFSGRLADRIGRRPLILTGLAVNGVFTGILGIASSFYPVLVLSALAGAGAGILNPAQQAVIADVIGTDRSGGKVLANFQMAQDAGTILGPIVVGFVAQTLGFTWGFAICGLITAVAFVGWLFGGTETLHRVPVAPHHAATSYEVSG